MMCSLLLGTLLGGSANASEEQPGHLVGHSYGEEWSPDANNVVPVTWAADDGEFEGEILFRFPAQTAVVTGDNGSSGILKEPLAPELEIAGTLTFKPSVSEEDLPEAAVELDGEVKIPNTNYRTTDRETYSNARKVDLSMTLSPSFDSLPYSEPITWEFVLDTTVSGQVARVGSFEVRSYYRLPDELCVAEISGFAATRDEFGVVRAQWDATLDYAARSAAFGDGWFVGEHNLGWRLEDGNGNVLPAGSNSDEAAWGYWGGGYWDALVSFSTGTLASQKTPPFNAWIDPEPKAFAPDATEVNLVAFLMDESRKWEFDAASSPFGPNDETILKRVVVATHTFEQAPRRPVVIVPGIAGCYAKGGAGSGFETIDDVDWLRNRGRPPETLTIDPLSKAYHDLIESLDNAGYEHKKTLFVANYDWRMTPGPTDDEYDGWLSEVVPSELFDNVYTHGLDYFAQCLKDAAEAWREEHGRPLDAVDVISHSTGGLVVRSYLQSDAHRAEYAPDKRLPGINQNIMIAVPHMGAPLIWNPWNNNWHADRAYEFVLSGIVNRAYKWVVGGGTISGPPGEEITRDSIADDNGEPCPVRFIRLYVPTIRSLLPTYPFLVDWFDNLVSLNGDDDFAIHRDEDHENSLLLDLNSELASTTNAVERTSIIRSLAHETVTKVEARVGPSGWLSDDPIAEMQFFGDREPEAGETWFEDVPTANSGDGTVPVDSANPFIGFSGVDDYIISPQSTWVFDDKTSQHTGLCSNRTVQELIFQILDFDPVPEDISTDLADIEYIYSARLGLDPVECWLTDGQGRKLGFVDGAGHAEWEGSVWLGKETGMGYSHQPPEPPLTVHFRGMNEAYNVDLALRVHGEEKIYHWDGFLADGETLTETVAFPEAGALRIVEAIRAPDGRLRLPYRGAADGEAVTLLQSPSLVGDWAPASGVSHALWEPEFLVSPAPGAEKMFYRVSKE